MPFRANLKYEGHIKFINLPADDPTSNRLMPGCFFRNDTFETTITKLRQKQRNTQIV